MFSQLYVRRVVALALAAATLLIDADAVRADVWSRPSVCDCDNAAPMSGWAMPSLEICSPSPFWMRPTPSYHSSWAKVPVTQYRSQVVDDPLSGASATTLQPCNTYEWQLRRTPGCALWHNFVEWWQSTCCQLHRPSPMTTCAPISQYAVSASESTDSPYYAPSSNNGRLVPVPSSAAPSSPVPADRRPQLDPVTPRPINEGSASRLLPPEMEVIVQSIDDSSETLELSPPLVGPQSQTTAADVADEQIEPIGDSSLELIPVGLSIATPSQESKLPTDEVWDDTGWRSEQ